MLATLLESPRSPQEFKTWSFSHYVAHQNIIDAVFMQRQVHLTRYLIDPMPIKSKEQMEGWLERHQLMHAEMNGTLNLPSQDLSTVDFTKPEQLKSWIWLHYQEMLAASSLLRI